MQKRIPRHERVAYFLALLKKNNERFTDPKKVHQYLRKCLDETEIFHEAFPSQMFIFPFSDFKYDRKYKIYVGETIKQTILLHTNGAYGIYQNLDNMNTEELELYKNGTCVELVHIPNLHDVPLWAK